MTRNPLLAGALAALALSGPALSATAATTAAAAPFAVGETQRLIRPDRPRHWRGADAPGLITRIWFPVDAAAARTPHDIGPPGHALFRGHDIAVDGKLPAAPPRFPLLLLSHGTGGSADSLDWLGAALAEAGYVVVAVNHPGNTALGPLTRDGFMLWWERATDLSDALDAMLADPAWAPRIDRDRIGAVGFSLGGYTVLELAGARTVPGALQAFCQSPAADAICHPPEASRTDLFDPPPQQSGETAASLARAGDSYRDPRVRAVFAIAPALGEAYGPKSFGEVRIPAAMVAGSADRIAPPDTNIRRIAGFLSSAGVTLLPGAGHYTFLDTCAPAAALALPLLCREEPGVDRDAVHAAAIAQAVAFFARTLR